ncbi:MAG: hypothetical protein PWQ57_1929 [Desulfovibrionales bacterium]|nr:hypothetical protein [Desulfovibrionales bacterium]
MQPIQQIARKGCKYRSNYHHTRHQEDRIVKRRLVLMLFAALVIGACSTKTANVDYSEKITDMADYSEGLAAVKIGDNWGYVNAAGELVIEPQFAVADKFSDGLAAVKFKNKWGVIDTKGAYAVIPHYEEIGKWSQGLMPVKLDGQWGFISPPNKIEIPMQFDDARAFSYGFAAVKLGSHWGYIDKKGRIVINPQFATAGDFNDGLAPASKTGEEDSFGYINAKGEFVIAPAFDDAGVFSNKLAAVLDDDKWGYIDTAGRMAINLKYDKATAFARDLAAVKLKELWGYINLKGGVVQEPMYKTAAPFIDKFALVSKPGGEAFYINQQGAQANGVVGVLAAPLPDAPKPMAAAKAQYRKGSKAGFVVLGPINYSLHTKGKQREFETDESRVFFSFHPADENPANKPVFVMLNGGPGAATSTNLFAMNTGPYTLDREHQEAGSKGCSPNPYSWTKLGNLLYIDAPATGFSYLSSKLSRNKVERYSLFFHKGNFNAFIDAAQVVRVLLKFLQENPEYEKSEIILVGESYGGTRVSTMLNLLLFHDRYGETEHTYCDVELVSLIKEHFTKINPGMNHADITPKVVAKQFKRQLLIQPQLTGAAQEDITSKMFFSQDGYHDSYMTDLAKETGNQGKFNSYNPLIWAKSFMDKVSCLNRKSATCAIMYWVPKFGRDRYNISKPKTWSDDLEAYSVVALNDVDEVSMALQYDIKSIDLMYAKNRPDGAKWPPSMQKMMEAGPGDNATNDVGEAYWKMLSETPELKQYLPDEPTPEVAMLSSHIDSLARLQGVMGEAGIKKESLPAQFGKLEYYDYYMAPMNYAVWASFALIQTPDQPYGINPDKSPRYGKMFLENVSLVNTFLTDAEFDAVIYSPAIPESLKTYKEIVEDVQYARGKNFMAGTGRGKFEIHYKKDSLAPYDTPDAVNLYYPYYNESGHSVSSAQPDKFRDDVEAWLKGE